MKELIHNGILVPKYEAKGFGIAVGGRREMLTPEQEEMAVAWVKKLETDYVKDPIFVENFFSDFNKAIGLSTRERLPREQFDFSEVIDYVQKEKKTRENLSKEEKKRQAEERKRKREENKEKYGYAAIDGVKVEIGAYMAEPSSIFMGRGQHPLRGRWKQGPRENDIILNYHSENNSKPNPSGNWKEIVWQPDDMWIAKWDDKLRGKEKYVWLADTCFLKQESDIEKFNKALELRKRVDQVLKHINKNLQSPDAMRRKVATVSYLIDALKLRVGDEKEEEEADTVGATTLRPEHIRFETNGWTDFDFLGKDAVRWEKKVQLPPIVIENLKEFIAEAKSTVFDGVRSNQVTAFLNEVMPGLSAKVFRTFHASRVVEDYLDRANVSPAQPDFMKKHVATEANLQAAMVCNHKRKPPKNFEESLAKRKERLEKLKEASARKITEARKRAVDKLEMKIKEIQETREYNLRTSLKSYIDPRLYYKWGKKVDYDWKQYYPKTFQRKFSWIEPGLKCEN
ncbi:MAG TPA: DNA topoisomerase I [Candidatus Bathyarchaeia archaeon]|nr:DNA topoisomerase I [Candidatus Bathyarchaeia archaeon]